MRKNVQKKCEKMSLQNEKKISLQCEKCFINAKNNRKEMWINVRKTCEKMSVKMQNIVCKKCEKMSL